MVDDLNIILQVSVWRIFGYFFQKIDFTYMIKTNISQLFSEVLVQFINVFHLSFNFICNFALL